MKSITRAIAAILLSTCLAAAVMAQTPATGAEVASLGNSAPAEKAGPNPVPAFTLSFVATALVLFIICKPTRKTT